MAYSIEIKDEFADVRVMGRVRPYQVATGTRIIVRADSAADIPVAFAFLKLTGRLPQYKTFAECHVGSEPMRYVAL